MKNFWNLIDIVGVLDIAVFHSVKDEKATRSADSHNNYGPKEIF